MAHRSVSQLLQYEKCPYSYYLTRVARVWERPAAWLAQGVAVHDAIDHWEKDDRPEDLSAMITKYSSVFDALIAKDGTRTPDLREWFNSGKWGAADDIPRRYAIGKEQLHRYVGFVMSRPKEIMLHSELRFDIDFGGVTVVGYIDSVVKDVTTGELILRDTKTGTSEPDPFQLHVYSWAVQKAGFEKPAYGQFISLKNKTPRGIAGDPVLLTIPEEEVTRRFRELDEGVTEERFDPKPGPDCGRCPVLDSCFYGKARQ